MRPLPGLIRNRNLYLALILGALTLIFWRFSEDGRFLWPINLENLLVNNTELAFVAFAMALVILSGGIDLSVGSTLALACCVMGLALNGGVPVPLSFLAGLVTGAACGYVNGLLITAGRLPPLLATLGTMMLFRGVGRGLTGGHSLSGFPSGVYGLASGTLLGLPNQFWMLLALLPLAFVLRRGRWYRELVAIGGNEPAARLAGVRVQRAKILAYTAAGLAAGLGAVLYVSRFGSVRSNFGLYLELNAITCVVLGGASIFGGRGSLIGALLGVAILAAAQSGIPLMSLKTGGFNDLAISQEWRTLMIGAILIGVVLLNERLSADRAV